MSGQQRVRAGVWRSRWAAIGAAIAVTFGAGGLVVVDAASSDPSSFVAVEPIRIMDGRRDVPSSIDPFESGKSQTLQVTGTVPTQPLGDVPPVNVEVVPAGATAVVLNATVVRPSTKGYLSIRPGDATGVPATSNINWAAGGANIANSVTVELPASGEINIFVNGTVGAVLIDIAGYMLPATSGPAGPAGPAGPVNRISDDQIALLQWYQDPGAAATFPTGNAPTSVASDGTSIWINNLDDNTVSKMNPVDGTKVDYDTLDDPQGVAFDGTSIWIANAGSNKVSKMNPADGTRVDYDTLDAPLGVAFDGTSIWIANSNSNKVSKMNPADGTRVDYDTGALPQAIAFDGTNIWITNFNDDEVSKMDPANGSKVNYNTGGTPQGIAFDGTNIWIANRSDNTVSKIIPG